METITINPRGIIDTLITGLADSSIGYWGTVDLRAARKAGCPNSGQGWEEDVAEWLQAGHPITIKEHEASGEDGHIHTVTWADVLRAVTTISERWPHHIGGIISGEGDATTGDVLVQVAALGDIVYG